MTLANLLRFLAVSALLMASPLRSFAQAEQSSQPLILQPVADRLLSERAVTEKLLRRGYRDIQIRRMRGASYIVHASVADGRVLIVIDGYTGEITGFRPLGWQRPYRPYHPELWTPPRPW